MDDSCAVCAETLEWVAYGPCGHKEVCSTCVARLRFICDDRRCCICKSHSDSVFVTKALGDYTRMINDFSLFPLELKEGRIGGSYWYHEHTQAIFDDLEQYKMIKEMCRLSCSVCDAIMEEESADAPRRRPRFRNIEQLKGHLFHQHKTLMCSLCLEGRKIFICEQKLYTRAQLNQHIQSGDSEVDGTESERGGFMGHPICEFCKTPFYGDNELFSHMSTEHFTCHICRRQHPGQYDYFKNYDDLENHFRGEHLLCEDEACLAKKFIVFTSESELKRHNAMEHGGSMSRSKRNAALQIPTSFRYQRSSEQSSRRGGGGRSRTFHRDYSEDQLPSSYEAPNNYETTANNDVDQLVQPLESLATTGDSSRYMLAVSSLTSRNAPLEDSSFPPLPAAPKNQKPEKLNNNSMASHFRRQNNVANVGARQSINASRFPQASSSSPSVGPIKAKFSSNSFPELSASSASASSSSGPVNTKFSLSGFPELSVKIASNGFPELPGSSSKNKAIISNSGAASAKFPASYSSLAKTAVVGSSSGSRIHHSSSAPNLASHRGAAVDTSSTSDFPPVSAVAAQVVRKVPASGGGGQPINIPKVEDVQTANKSLVERIRSALDFDEDKYTAFKEISGEYRQGMIDAETYLSYVDQFGLLHLLLELARLCPDPDRQRTLIATYNANLRSSSSAENGRGSSSSSKKKGKGKCLDGGSDSSTSSKDKFADNVINTVRKLQSSHKPSEEIVEVLSKDGYRDSKGKAKIMVPPPPLVDTSSQSSQPGSANPVIGGGSNNQNMGDAAAAASGGGGKGGGKKQKKTSKFHRVRLGDGSVAALLDLKNSEPDPDLKEDASDSKNNTTDGVPVRGAWRNGGGHKLVAMTSKSPNK